MSVCFLSLLMPLCLSVFCLCACFVHHTYIHTHPGVSLYFMVHGKCPFINDNFIQLLEMIQNQPIKSVSCHASCFCADEYTRTYACMVRTCHLLNIRKHTKVYIYIYIYIYMNTYRCIYRYNQKLPPGLLDVLHTYKQTYMHTYEQTYMHTYKHIHAHIDAHVHIHVCAHYVCTYRHIHACTCMYTFTIKRCRRSFIICCTHT
jgi:hypothetical protein